MKVKKLHQRKVSVALRMLVESGFVKEDGDNYIVPKSLLKAAMNDVDTVAPSFAGDRNITETRILTFIQLFKRFKELYKDYHKMIYRPASNDWAALRHTALSFGVPQCADHLEQYFSEESVKMPSIMGFDKFMSRQHTLGNIRKK